MSLCALGYLFSKFCVEFFTLIQICRAIGLYKKDELYDHTTLKCKIVFILINYIYFLVVILPAPLLFYNQFSHALMLIIVIIASIINGASYYIDVFTSRYYSKLEKRAKELEKTLNLATPKILKEKSEIKKRKVAQEEEIQEDIPVEDNESKKIK